MAFETGKPFYDMLSPYVVARVFGGPILWSAFGGDRQGTDRYKFQFGLGLVVTGQQHRIRPQEISHPRHDDHCAVPGHGTVVR